MLYPDITYGDESWVHPYIQIQAHIVLYLPDDCFNYNIPNYMVFCIANASFNMASLNDSKSRKNE